MAAGRMVPGGNVAQRQSGRFISARSLVRAQSLPPQLYPFLPKTALGTCSSPIHTGNLDELQFINPEVLADTGASCSFDWETTLRLLGVEVREMYQFEWADDQVVEYPVGLRLDLT